MATKRRKVWVNEYAGNRALSRCAWPRRVDALCDIASDGKAVCLVERLPGDVVLSRERQNKVANEVARELVAEGYDEDDAPMIAGVVVRALLRGGR